jgi:tRNA modification GTPase
MYWNFSSLFQKDTIAAIATPPGNGAIAIVRMSGEKALDILQRVFSKDIKNATTHTIHYGHIFDKDGQILDTTLVLFMQGPHTYTGETIIEINCHGGQVVTKNILQRLVEEGARPAQPGEFTYRAYKNGKIDLVQAEAIQELIFAQNDKALSSALHHLEGKLSQKIENWQKRLTETAAILEAWVDFPEEDLAFAPFEEIIESIQVIMNEMELLIDTYHEGKKIQEGFHISLVGSPNVGKSSIMNLLLGKNRSIVTPIAGTTRDTIEEDLILKGYHFHLKDTAGIRETEEIIEQEGIKRAKIALAQSDIILLVFDASRKFSEEDINLIKLCPKEKTIYLWNKMDLTQKPPETIQEKPLLFSAKNELGLQDLKNALLSFVENKKTSHKEEIYLTHQRHKELLQKAHHYCTLVLEGLKKKNSAEFVAFDMRFCLLSLSAITGGDVEEDILSSIFSQFCIGK